MFLKEQINYIKIYYGNVLGISHLISAVRKCYIENSDKIVNWGINPDGGDRDSL
jgi:hypothetical protein